MNINKIKFGLSEKKTKFEKKLPCGFDKSADLLSKRQNHEEDCFKYVCFSKSPNFKKTKKLLFLKQLDLISKQKKLCLPTQFSATVLSNSFVKLFC